MREEERYVKSAISAKEIQFWEGLLSKFFSDEDQFRYLLAGDPEGPANLFQAAVFFYFFYSPRLPWYW